MISSKYKRKGRHNIYVVELDEKVFHEDFKFRKANQHYTGRLGCLYVGMTSHTPQERFVRHKTGYRTKKGIKIASKYVEKYGKFLRPSLYTHFNPMTKNRAIKMEVLLAESLRKRGYAVWWN